MGISTLELQVNVYVLEVSLTAHTDRYFGSNPSINSVHVFMELRTMSVPVPVVMGYKEIGMNHLVQKGLYQVLPGPQGQQGFGETDGTKPTAGLVSAYSCTPNDEGGIKTKIGERIVRH